MKSMILNIALSIGIPIVLGIFVAIVKKSRGKTVNLGIKIGIFLSSFLNKGLFLLLAKFPIISKSAQDIRDMIDNTIIDLCNGIEIGVRLDDPDAKKIADVATYLTDAQVEDAGKNIDGIKK